MYFKRLCQQLILTRHVILQDKVWDKITNLAKKNHKFGNVTMVQFGDIGPLYSIDVGYYSISGMCDVGHREKCEPKYHKVNLNHDFTNLMDTVF